jgi:hypothetical protein
MQTFYGLTTGRGPNAQRPKPDALRGIGFPRSLRAGRRSTTPNEIVDLLLGDPLPTRLDRRRRTTGRQSADVDEGDGHDRPFGCAGPPS